MDNKNLEVDRDYQGGDFEDVTVGEEIVKESEE